MTPEEEQQVAAALAAAAHPPAGPRTGAGTSEAGAWVGSAGRVDPPTPPDVVARLDRVLADLVTARAAAAGSGDVGSDDGTAGETGAAGTDELARRRAARRPPATPRRWPHVLVAAAAVAVIAVAGGAVVTHGFGSSGGDSATSAADSAGGSSDSGVAEDGAGGGSGSGGSGARSLAPDASSTPSPSGSEAAPSPAPERVAALPRLRSDHLSRDVARTLVVLGRTSAPGGTTSPSPDPSTGGDTPPDPTASPRAGALSSDGRLLRPVPAGCTPPPAGSDDQRVAVLLDDEPATLVLSPVADGAREARVYACDGTAVRRATTVVQVP